MNYVARKNCLPFLYWFKTNIRKYVTNSDLKISVPRGSSLIIGAYGSNDGSNSIKLTSTGEKLNDNLGNKILQMLQISGSVPHLGEVRLLYGLDSSFNVIAVSGLGDKGLGFNLDEQLDERKEYIRIGIGAAIKELQKLKVFKVYVDSCGHAESAAEGASLASWVYQDLKGNRDVNRLVIPSLQLFDSCDLNGWQIGLHKASAQNLARNMSETPSNLLTPSAFAQSAVEMLSKYAINVEVRMHNWAKLRNMNAFLSIGMGSCEPPVFLELLYEGCDPTTCPVVLIGKGITFNTGGLCLKPFQEMEYQRGDMSGAAAVVATFRAIASLHLPLNVRGLIPLCINALGASSLKPGDTIKSMSGKTIYVEDSDASCGSLIMADTLTYAKTFNPKFIIDVGTMTPGATATMSSAASLVFSNSDALYETLRIASVHTGDRIWRFPLWQYFNEYLNQSPSTDIKTMVAPCAGAEPAKVTSFLYNFVPRNTDWIHMDTYNLTTTNGDEYTYLRPGMSGRPTRTLIEFLAQLCCKHSVEKQTESTIQQKCDKDKNKIKN